MRTVVEPLEGNKVKLSIEVDEQEFERSVEAAFRKIAQEVRIPGFRPGKAPRRVLEARLGAGTGRAEALRDSLPEYYAQALREHEVDAIAPPTIDITAGEDAGAVAFDAVVEVRPQVSLVGYQGLRVEVPSPEVTDEEVDAQVDRLRANFGELVPVERPAVEGDNLTVDIEASRDGETVPGLSITDFLYELGSGTVLPELDEHLAGVGSGETATFEAALPDGPVQLEVTVKEVKEKILPDATDEWASDASEFETVAELRADLRKRLSRAKRLQAAMALRSGAIDAVVELVDIEVPEPLVQAELERRAHDLGHRLEQQGATLAQWLAATGRTEEQAVAELREGAVPAVKADLALRALAEAEGIEASEDELAAEIARLATAYQTTPAVLVDNLERAGQMGAVRSDVKKSKALEWLVEHVELVDPEGRPVDRALLALDDPGEDGAEQPAADPGPAGTEPAEPSGTAGSGDDPESGES